MRRPSRARGRRPSATSCGRGIGWPSVCSARGGDRRRACGRGAIATWRGRVRTCTSPRRPTTPVVRPLPDAHGAGEVPAAGDDGRGGTDRSILDGTMRQAPGPDSRRQSETAPDESRPCGSTREYQSDQPSHWLPRPPPTLRAHEERETNNDAHTLTRVDRSFHISSDSSASAPIPHRQFRSLIVSSDPSSSVPIPLRQFRFLNRQLRLRSRQFRFLLSVLRFLCVRTDSSSSVPITATGPFWSPIPVAVCIARSPRMPAHPPE